jgi:hypothetical protein
MCVYIHTVGGDSHSSLAVWLAWSLPVSKCSCSVPSNDSIKHIVREFSFYHLSERKQSNPSCRGGSARPIPVRMHRGGGELSGFWIEAEDDGGGGGATQWWSAVVGRAVRGAAASLTGGSVGGGSCHRVKTLRLLSVMAAADIEVSGGGQ